MDSALVAPNPVVKLNLPSQSQLICAFFIVVLLVDIIRSPSFKRL
ncbi:hypothetical protein VCHENC02_5757, partial [Vibrio harveyi]